MSQSTWVERSLRLHHKTPQFRNPLLLGNGGWIVGGKNIFPEWCGTIVSYHGGMCKTNHPKETTMN